MKIRLLRDWWSMMVCNLLTKRICGGLVLFVGIATTLSCNRQETQHSTNLTEHKAPEGMDYGVRDSTTAEQSKSEFSNKSESTLYSNPNPTSGKLEQKSGGWITTSWDENEDLVYRGIERRILNTIREHSVSECLKTASDFVDRCRNKPLTSEELFEVTMWLRSVRWMEGRNEYPNLLKLSLLSRLWQKSAAPKSYRYCRLAFLIAQREDQPCPPDYYKKLLLRDPHDWDVVRSQAMYMYENYSLKVVPDKCDRALAMLGTIPKASRIVYDDHLSGLLYKFKYGHSKDKEDLAKAIKFFEVCVNTYNHDENNRKILIDILPVLRKELGEQKKID